MILANKGNTMNKDVFFLQTQTKKIVWKTGSQKAALKQKPTACPKN